jgi:hypothetical protein
MATFGNLNAETGTAPGFSNYAIVGRFQADGSGTITKLTARLSNDDAGELPAMVVSPSAKIFPRFNLYR